MYMTFLIINLRARDTVLYISSNQINRMNSLLTAGRNLLPAKRSNVIPGFGLTMGFTLFYMSMLILIPLGGLVFFTTSMGWDGFWQSITDPRVVSSLRLSFGASFLAATLNAFFGLIVAWVLVRYTFPFKKVVDALVDLPFALPTAVSGIALVTIYSQNGIVGRYVEPLGLQIAFTWVGIVIALTLIGLPFVVRTVQPALEDLEKELEEASASLGASRWQTFRRVIFPAIQPSLLTGFAMALARAIGEYGSVIFIAGNMPFKTEIAPLLIVIKLEQFDYTGATAIAVVMLIAAFLILLFINLIQWWSRRYTEEN
jgi:sulfate/thiosulfate transport system permease protein